MNNGELYKQAFGALHAPDTVSLTAGKGAERKTFRPARRLVLVCACTVLALGLAVTAYARGGLILGHVFGWGNNMEVTTGIDEKRRKLQRGASPHGKSDAAGRAARRQDDLHRQ